MPRAARYFMLDTLLLFMLHTPYMPYVRYTQRRAWRAFDAVRAAML